MLTIMIFMISSGLILAGLSVPMILGKIPPNGLYGFRVKKTMENPLIWYAVNTFSGKRLLVSSLIMVLAAVCFSFIPGLSVDMYSYAVLGVWTVTFTYTLVVSVRYMNSM